MQCAKEKKGKKKQINDTEISKRTFAQGRRESRGVSLRHRHRNSRIVFHRLGTSSLNHRPIAGEELISSKPTNQIPISTKIHHFQSTNSDQIKNPQSNFLLKHQRKNKIRGKTEE